MSTQRITVTLPPDLVEQIDRMEPNRSRFITDAILRELDRRRRESLYESLRNPHPEGLEVAEAGFDDWASQLSSDSNEDTDELVDPNAGKPVRWQSDLGWSPAPEKQMRRDGDKA